MGHYDDRDIPFYWNVADEYVLFDRFFTSARAGSVQNHMFWVTGTPGNPDADTIPAKGFGKIPTIFDRLQEKGIPWKFYVQNYDPGINFRNPGKLDRASQRVWVPLLNYARYLDNPELYRAEPVSILDIQLKQAQADAQGFAKHIMLKKVGGK